MWQCRLVNHQPQCQITAATWCLMAVLNFKKPRNTLTADTERSLIQMSHLKWQQTNKHVKCVLIRISSSSFVPSLLCMKWRRRPAGVSTSHASEYLHRWWFYIIERINNSSQRVECGLLICWSVGKKKIRMKWTHVFDAIKWRFSAFCLAWLVSLSSYPNLLLF